MRPWTIRTALLSGVAVLAISCANEGPTAPERLTLSRLPLASAVGPSVRISEIHYDNAGTDAGEAIEISAPAGSDLTGWSVVLYNGASTSLATYNTRALSEVVPTTCDERGVVVLSYPVNGIQNGNPDGVALVDAGGAVVEFLSYGGVFTASNGPASGLTSADIGVAEVTTTPVGSSLQRNEDGTWTTPIPNSFGACNDGTTNDEEEPAVVVRVSVDPATATVVVGATTDLVASAFDAADAPIPAATFAWSSLDAAIATVDATGTVTGVAAGEASIVATASNGVADTAIVTVTAAPVGDLPPTRFSEIHYDNDGNDVNEAIEIEGPAGTDLTGWSVVLYNQTGGVSYSTTALTATIPAQCDGRGTVVVNYPANGVQNGPADGFALVNAGGTVVEFLSYEGTLTATNGPAAGLTSTDIGVSEPANSPATLSLQRAATGVWNAPATATLGVCNGSDEPPPPPANSIFFSGRVPGDAPLPVGFEDQIFAQLRSGTGSNLPSTFTWVSETPAIASIDPFGVMRALGAGTAIVRATAHDGTTASYALPTSIAVPSTTAIYGGNTEFGDPTDGDASDEIIIRRDQLTSSFSAARGIPNWVSYAMEASHFGTQDRCECFTYDPELPAAGRYTTADYTGAGAAAGYGIDRGHLARSFDRTAGDFDNAMTFYFSNIIPQASDNNQGPWGQLENHLGDFARFSDREVYVIAGASGSKGTVKNEGRITIPQVTWKVAVIMPRNTGLSSVHSAQDVQTIAVIMPNDAGIRNVAWQTYQVTIDQVEAVSGFDVLSLLRDDIEVAVESGTQAPQAALDGPWSTYSGDPLALSAAASADADGDALTYAWDFGDGNVGSGATVTHTYGAPGTYGVRVIVTDTRGLADTATSSAVVTHIPTIAGIDRAISRANALVTAGVLKPSQGVSLTAPLQTARKAAARGNLAPVAPTVQAALNLIEAWVQAGRLTAAQAAPLVAALDQVLAGL